MRIIVGRKGTQAMTITDTSVSREHCAITPNQDGTYIVENLSPNNYTVVNGQTIIKTVADAEALIQLGPVFKCRIKDLVRTSTPPKGPTPPVTENYSEAFSKLERVYYQYERERIQIDKDAQMVGVRRMVPSALIMLIGIVTTLIPALKSALMTIVLFVIAAFLMVYAVASAKKSASERPERLAALNRKFQIDYVCPKCKHFLGFTPFESLRNRGKCDYCKCNWK